MRQLFTILFLCFFIISNAQDMFIYKNGDEIAVKVIRVNQNDIIYKKYSNIHGPEYTEEKSNIFMIKYKNGEKDVFKESISKSEKIDEEFYTLRGGELIPLYLKESLTSKDITSGTIVRFAVLEDIVGSNGKIIISANTHVNGRITEAKKAAWAGQKGKLNIQINSIKAVDGTNIPVFYNAKNEGKSRMAGTIIVGALFLWPILFVKGEQASIDAGTAIIVETLGDVTLNTYGFKKRVVAQNPIQNKEEILNKYKIKENPCGDRPKKPPTFNNPQYKKTPEYKVYYKKLNIWRNCSGN